MTKTKKLLSVLLAVVLVLSSFTIMGSAAKTEYQTIDELTALGAYSPYGQVTRLSTEERTSIVFDALDIMLAKLNINMGTVINVLGLTVTINLTSVDNICASFDSIYDTWNNWLFSIAKAIVNLGVLEELNVDPWENYQSMTRDTYDQYTILTGIVSILSGQTSLIETVLTDGIELGLIGNFIKGLDMTSINEMVTNLPAMVKGLVGGLLERKDDTKAEIEANDTWASSAGGVNDKVNEFVQALFVDNRSTTTVKYDANGNMTSEHSGLPIVTSAPSTTSAAADTALRYVYYKDSSGYLWTYHIADEAEAEADETITKYAYVKETVPYELKEEVAGSGVYTWQATDDWGNTWTLKYYNDNSPWLPSLAEDIAAGTTTIDLYNDSISAGDLLYTMIPYVFEEMAPVVLNGSLKKILGGLFGAKYTYVGEVGDDAVAALAAANGNDTFFTEEQGEYLWEWSNYAVIDGNHFYRFEDQIFSCDTSNTNEYFDVIDWEYEITGDFLNEFIPENDDSSSDRILDNVNDFLVKVVNTVFADDFVSGITLTSGSNSNLVTNVKNVAQAFIKHSPEDIFGSDYQTNDRCYYNLLINSDNDTVLTGIAAQLVDMIMPSMYLPGASDLLASNAKVGAILAAVIREFAASLVPEYNYDALIYADFGTTTADPDKTFVDPEAAGLLTDGSTASGYWFDVILTMALDVGYEYLRAFGDLGEDTDYCAGAVGAGYMAAGGTYAAGTTQATLNAQWEGMLDYIIDWALEADLEWTWKFEKILDCSGITIDLATAQDPFAKLDAILLNLLPIEEVLTISKDDCDSKVEQFLRHDLILGIVDLDWAGLIDTVKLDGTNAYFRTGNILEQLALLIKGIVNGIFAYVGNANHDYEFIPSAITDFDSLAQQANIRTLVVNLVGTLKTALIDNGLASVIFPFVNFILGWKVDPQVMADPYVYNEFYWANDYALQYGISAGGSMLSDYTLIKVTNNSSGMLESHTLEDGSVVNDHAYDIVIESITSNASVNSLTFTSDITTIAPYETATIKVGGTYNGDEAVTVTIAYSYVGKDGTAYGGTQYITNTFLISNLVEDSTIDGRWDSDDDKDYTGTDNFKTFVFTEDIYNTVVNYEKSIYFCKATVNLVSSRSFESCQPEGYEEDCDGNVTSAGKVPTGTAANYFSQYMGQDGGWASTLYADSDPSTTTAKLFYANSGVSAETEFPYGAYDMGGVGIKYGSDTKVHYVDFIYYTDYDVDVVWGDFSGKNITIHDIDSSDSAAVTAYNNYVTAMQKVCYLAKYPMMTTARNLVDSADVGTGTSSNDYVAVIMPQIEAAIAALIGTDNEDGTHTDGAWDVLAEYLEDASASAGADSALPSYVTALEQTLAADGWSVNPDITPTDDEINYTDYQYYEYFNYADRRTAARNLVKTYYAPEILDTYYIEGSTATEEEIDEIIAAESNSYIADGITASRMENTAEAINASIVARDAWVQPTNTELNILDIQHNLEYYKQFIKTENDDMLYFLNQEIAHVEAQGFAEADYTEATWADYEEALANAKTIAASAESGLEKNSDLYSAKWNLMVARKNLLEKDNSVLYLNGEEIQNLATLADQADVIFSTLGQYYGVKEDYNEDEAYAALIKALGYEYDGAVDEDDDTYYNLYADSALEYLSNDRPARQSNLNKINASADALKNAIDMFECTIKLEDKDDGYAAVEQEVKYINGITPGSIASVADLLNHVEASVDGATLEAVASAAGALGTGAYVNVNVADIGTLAVYYVVIYGDVNGDGAVDTFDAMEIDIREASHFSSVYAAAADVDGDGTIGTTDYAAIKAASAAGAQIAQTK